MKNYITYASQCICFSMIHLLKQIIAGAHNPVSRDQGANIYHLHMDMNMCNVSMEQVSLCACKYHIVSTTKTRKRSSNQKTKAQCLKGELLTERGTGNGLNIVRQKIFLKQKT